MPVSYQQHRVMISNGQPKPKMVVKISKVNQYKYRITPVMSTFKVVLILALSISLSIPIKLMTDKQSSVTIKNTFKVTKCPLKILPSVKIQSSDCSSTVQNSLATTLSQGVSRMSHSLLKPDLVLCDSGQQCSVVKYKYSNDILYTLYNRNKVKKCPYLFRQSPGEHISYTFKCSPPKKGHNYVGVLSCVLSNRKLTYCTLYLKTRTYNVGKTTNEMWCCRNYSNYIICKIRTMQTTESLYLEVGGRLNSRPSPKNKNNCASFYLTPYSHKFSSHTASVGSIYYNLYYLLKLVNCCCQNMCGQQINCNNNNFNIVCYVSFVPKYCNQSKSKSRGNYRQVYMCYRYQYVFYICTIQSNEVSSKSIKIINGNILRNNKLKIIQWNKGSSNLIGSIEEVEVLMQNESPDILTLSESMVLSTDNLDEIYIDGYQIEQADTFTDLGISRSCVYIKSTVQYIRRRDLEGSPISTVWIEVIVPRASNLLVMGGYRQWSLPGDFGLNSHTSNSQQERWDRYCSQWEAALSEGKEVIVSADDNIDSTNWNNNYNIGARGTKAMYNVLVDRIFTKGVIVMNHKVTRQIGVMGPSIIDHIYSTHPHKIIEVFTRSHGRSDHRMIGIIWTSARPVQSLGYIKSRKDHKITDKLLQDKIKESNLVQNILNETDVNLATTLFITSMETILENISPMKIIQLTKNYCPYLGEEEKAAVKNRAELYDRARSINTIEAWREYKNIKNSTTSLIKKAKKRWLSTKLNNVENSKDVWSIAKTFWKFNQEGPPRALNIDGQISCKPIEMANELNNKYIKKVKDFRRELNNINKKDPMLMLTETTKRGVNRFIIKEITTAQTVNLLQSFKSTSAKGPDTITVSHIKKAGQLIVPVIKHLINLSVQQSTVANILK
jgi:hypothetical protein